MCWTETHPFPFLFRHWGFSTNTSLRHDRPKRFRRTEHVAQVPWPTLAHTYSSSPSFSGSGRKEPHKGYWGVRGSVVRDRRSFCDWKVQLVNGNYRAPDESLQVGAGTVSSGRHQPGWAERSDWSRAHSDSGRNYLGSECRDTEKVRVGVPKRRRRAETGEGTGVGER